MTGWRVVIARSAIYHSSSKKDLGQQLQNMVEGCIEELVAVEYLNWSRVREKKREVLKA